jgi:ethanolamine utilization protein EutN
MIIGKVIGNVWATRKDERLNGFKFLVVKSLYQDNKIFVAADAGVGAGLEDLVLIVSGSSARVSLDKKSDIPIDATIVGVIDKVDIDKTFGVTPTI